MANFVPLEDETLTAVLARVAFRCVQVHYHLRKRKNIPQSDTPYGAMLRLEAAGFHAIARTLSAMMYSTHIQGGQLRQARDRIVARSRIAAHNRASGRPWRRV